MDDLDRLAREYLDNCYPVDFGEHQPGDHRAVAQGLLPEGMEQQKAVRLNVLRRLARCETQTHAEAAACRQLQEWVAADHELMESGEKYRQFHEVEGPFYRQSLAIRVALEESKISWEAVAGSFDTMAATAANFARSLDEGISKKALAGREEAEALLSQLDAIGDRSSGNLIEHYLATASIPDAVDVLVRGSAERFRESLHQLADHVRRKYLPHVVDAHGIGPERYGLWATKLLGPGSDLSELYDYSWANFNDLRAQMEALAQLIDPGSRVADVMWRLDSSPENQARTAQGVRDWALGVYAHEADAVDGRIVHVSQKVRDFRIVVSHEQSSERVAVIEPSKSGDRAGIALIRPNAEIQIPTWTLYGAIHASMVPGVHVLNCALGESESGLRRFQRVLASPVSREGWGVESQALAATLLSRQTHRAHLALLSSQARQMLRVTCDIGYHLGLTVPADASEHAGERWTKDLVAFLLAHWANLSRTEATSEAQRIVQSPGVTLAATVGGRVRDTERRRAQRAAGSSFELCEYHERVLRVAPGGAAQLRDELRLVGESLDTSRP